MFGFRKCVSNVKIDIHIIQMKLLEIKEILNGNRSKRQKGVTEYRIDQVGFWGKISRKSESIIALLITFMIPFAVIGQEVSKDSLDQKEIVQDDADLESKMRRTKLLWGRGLHGRPMDFKRKELIYKKREKLIGKWKKTKLLSLEVIEEVENEFYMERINLPEGDTYRIECMDGYIDLRAHSMHKNKKYGDVVVARTSRGDWYMNAGHICGDRINFVNFLKKGPLTESSFFSYFKSDADQMPWREMNVDAK